MSNEKNTLQTEENNKKSRNKNSIKKSYEETFAGVNKDFLQDSQIPEADFVKIKSSKENRKKHVKKVLFGIDKEEVAIGKRQKLYKNLFTIFFIIFVIGVLAFTAYRDFFASGRDFPSWETFWAIIKDSWLYLFYALFALFLTYFFKALKLSIMCKSLTKKFHFLTCFETAIIGSYYNNVTPLAVGGQPFEIYHLSKHGVHGGAASSIPIAAFMLNQFAFVILGTVCISLFKDNYFNIPLNIYALLPTTFLTLAIIGLICCLVMPLLVTIFSLTPKIGTRLVHFVMWIGGKLRLVKNPKETTLKTIKNVVHNATCLKKICSNPIVFISSFLVSFLEHLASVSIAFFVLRAFGYGTTGTLEGVSTFTKWVQVAQICIILFASVAFIPTPGNSGAADLSFFLLFEVGLYAGLAFPAMATWRLFCFYSYIIIGFVFATLKKRADNKKEALLQTQTDGFIDGEASTNIDELPKEN